MLGFSKENSSVMTEMCWTSQYLTARAAEKGGAWVHDANALPGCHKTLRHELGRLPEVNAGPFDLQQWERYPSMVQVRPWV